MNKFTKFIVLYAGFASTIVIISSILITRNVISTQSQTNQDILSIKSEVEKINKNLDAKDKLSGDIDKIRAEIAQSRKNTEEVSSEKTTFLGSITVSGGYQTIDVYQDTSFSANIVGNLSASNTYSYLKKDGSWYQVQVSDNLIGWVNSRFVKEQETKQP